MIFQTSLDAALLLLSLTISHFLELETIYNLNIFYLHQIFKVMLAHVKPLCTCATLPLYKYIEKTKWKLYYIYVFQFSRIFHNKLITFLNPKIILAYISYWKKKKKKVKKDFREEFRNKTQISWFLVCVFACSSPFSHFFISFQLFLTANKSSKLSAIFDLQRYSGTSHFLQVCLPKSSDPKIDYYIDICSRSPLMMWETRLPEVSPVNLMLTMTVQIKCI